jgi:DNA-directed RNA polymerase subunit RPC12/RpoP
MNNKPIMPQCGSCVKEDVCKLTDSIPESTHMVLNLPEGLTVTVICSAFLEGATPKAQRTKDVQGGGKVRREHVYTKVCKICGKEFESNGARATTCPDCRKKAFANPAEPIVLKNPVAPPLPPPGDPHAKAKAQIKETNRLLKEYGTTDLSEIAKIKSEKGSVERIFENGGAK